MTVARPSLLVPWIALGLLARVVLGPGESVPRGAEDEASRAPAAALCGSHGCGCPHEVVPASCCCKGDGPRVAPAPVQMAPVLRRSDVRVDGASALPEWIVKSLECSGASSKKAAAATGAAPPALHACALLLTEHGCGNWTTRSEPGPLFDLGTEPSTPPPRRATRA